jgi:DNA invertase Pin-like site-specific DNA recombinase
VVDGPTKNPQNACMTSTRVYSYRRFSSGRQAHGHSLERQTASARAWCIEHGHELDEEFEISDIATSAYTGKNATDGALAAFLLAAKDRKVPSGSILLVESLDRLSRNHLTEAIALLTSIVRTGVRVVSLLDGKEWNRDNINDTMNFMMSVLLFARAHEESATKAKRVRAAFAKKRDAGLPVVSHGHGPGWAFPREDRQGWVVDEPKADSVRFVFEHVAGGLGGIAIARLANAEGWPLPWRNRANTNTRWEHTQVSRLVRDRRVLGEWQPKQMVDGALMPLGNPVAEYFPRVITDELWAKVHIALDGRTGIPRIRGVKADVMAGLFYCSCGEKMQRKAPWKRGYARYYCLGQIAGKSKCRSISEAAIIDHGFSFLATLEHGQFQETDALRLARTAIDDATAKLAELDERATRYADAIEQGDGQGSRLITQRLREIETQQDALHAQLNQRRADLAAAPKAGVDFGALFASDVRAAVLDRDAVKERHRIATALNRLLTKVVWNPSIGIGTLMMYTRDGGMAAYLFQPGELDKAVRRDKGRGK